MEFAMTQHSYSEIRYPWRREELVLTLRTLSDPLHQEKYWAKELPPEDGTIDCFDSVVHLLFDDLNLEDYPMEAIGVLFYDDYELNAVLKVVAAIRAVLDDVGLEGCDADYVHSTKWPDVVAFSADAVEVLTSR